MSCKYNQQVNKQHVTMLLNSGNEEQTKGLHITKTINTSLKIALLTFKPRDSCKVLSAVYFPHSSLSVISLFPHSEMVILRLSQCVKTAKQVQSCLRSSDKAWGKHRQGKLSTENWWRKKFSGSGLTSHHIVAHNIVGPRVIADKTNVVICKKNYRKANKIV